MSARLRRMPHALHTWIGSGLLLVAGLVHANTVHYYYTDPQGTVLAKADAQGAIVARYDYAPYGTSAPNLDAAPAGPGYTGHVNDPDTGLVYMQARYYDPVVGRFLSEDPVGPSAGNVFNVNRYDYANNNPIVNMDADGRCTGSLNQDGAGNCADSGSTTSNSGPSSGGVHANLSPRLASVGSRNGQEGKSSVPEKVTRSGTTYPNMGDAAKAFGGAYYAKGVKEKSEYQTGIVDVPGGYDYMMPGHGPQGATMVDPTPLFNSIKDGGFRVVAWDHTHWDENLKFSGADMLFAYKSGVLYLTNRNGETYMLDRQILNRAASGYGGAEGMYQFINGAKNIQGDAVP